MKGNDTIWKVRLQVAQGQIESLEGAVMLLSTRRLGVHGNAPYSAWREVAKVDGDYFLVRRSNLEGMHDTVQPLTRFQAETMVFTSPVQFLTWDGQILRRKLRNGQAR